jgi:hypothetical protein
VSELQIREVDPRDETALRSWWEVGRDASAERPLEAWPVWEVSRAMLPVPRTDGQQILLQAVQDGRVVGSARLWFFGHDNTHLVEAGVWVVPQACCSRPSWARSRPGTWTSTRPSGPARLRENEARAIASGRCQVIAVALAPDGDLVGCKRL